ncbi:hypothetical protein EVAR_33272_1 [Eumeta japonica]|uniref:Uncharacterized protein n=1 Tax=Eumeta variegata TaxID=151549 RepID=A0A4C1X0P2_EUMVA|nr:hypothetical protein EVAR_33272_1 [Eumeta japonica]
MNAIDTERIVRFIIEKFDGKNSSASRWMEVFEECARFGIEEDAEKLRYSGSLLDYAVKKERLLLEVRKTMDEGTLIDIIAAGLPDFITDRINKEDILHTKDLFNELGKLEHLVVRKKNFKKKEEPKLIKEKCTICEKLKKGVRYHPEDSCWFKAQINTEKDKKQIRLINNSELECELQCEDQKN